MRLFDLSALRAGFALIVNHPLPVLGAAAVYGALHAGAAVAGAPALSAVAALGGLAVAITALTAFLGAGLEGRSSPRPVEIGRIALSLLLIVVLAVTVLGTALLALGFMLVALAMIGADRAGMAGEPEGDINVFALFGTGEWIVAAVLIAAFAGLSLWLLSRLALAGPATLDRGRVQALASWPLTRGRWVAIALVSLTAILPGAAALYLIEAAGLPTAAAAFAQGAVGIALVLAPLAHVHTAFYMNSAQ